MTEQKPSNQCVQCNIKFGNHYCDICHLWTDDIIFHCQDCGFCRKGTDDEFNHCQTCGTCMKIEHQCRKNILNANCAICLEDLFNSFKGVMVMECGHSIHQECFMSYINSDYRCPVCHRSAFDVTPYWKNIEEFLSIEKMPDPYDKWKTKVYCLDCQENSIAPYHYQYHQCQACRGFNTQKLGLIPYVAENDEIIEEP